MSTNARAQKVEVSAQHMKKLIASSPQSAIEELLWNALDAGGDSVEVKLTLTGLGTVDALEIVDHGTGIPFEDLPRAFGKIGDSVKPNKKQNAEGRQYHGSEGKGRFKALALAPQAIWQTVYSPSRTAPNLSYTIEVNRVSADHFTPSEPATTKLPTGTRLILRGIDKGMQILAQPEFPYLLTETFALYLLMYPKVRINWDGNPLDVVRFIRHRTTLEVLDSTDPLGTTMLDIVEWSSLSEARRLYICDEHGFALHDIAPGVQAPGIHYSAYIRTPMARSWAETATFVSEETDPEFARLIEAAKSKLKAHLRSRLAEEAQSVVEEWKKQEIYPFATEPGDQLAAAEREVFDIVAVQINTHHPTFVDSDPQSKKLTLALVKNSLESSPTDMARVLRELVKLNPEDQRALADLLRRTPLTNLIRAGKQIADRLDTLQAFQTIVFEEDWRSTLLERTQLHRLLVHELWILGEEYALGVDDEGLQQVLKKHIAILGRTELAPEAQVNLLDGGKGIVDLMLYRRQKVDRDLFEHVVVELKRPDCKLGADEISQIEKYAFAIARDERFDTHKVRWQFWLLANDYDKYVAERLRNEALPAGCIHQRGGLSIWVKRWSDVFADADARLHYFKDQLKVAATKERGLELMRERYAHLLAPGGATKKQEAEILAARAKKQSLPNANGEEKAEGEPK